jgi:hypothetical protein
VRTTRHAGYRLSANRAQTHRGAFWPGQDLERIRQTVFRGLARVDQQFKPTMTAINLMRMARMPIAVLVVVQQ